MDIKALTQRRERLLGTQTPLFYEEPIHIIRGEGINLFDADGKQYVDMYNNVPCVGHANPRVVNAMQAQAATLNVHSRYLHEGILDYAERLIDLHAESLSRAVFCCTGTEASEIALRMARAATGGRGIICTDATYHGNSTEVVRLSAASRDGAGNPEIRAIPYPQQYRSLDDNASEAELCALYLTNVRAAIDDLAANNIPLAGMMVCSLMVNEGLPDIPAGFMAGAAEMVRAAGGVFIADEVQAGFCRSGRWWGYEESGFVPDIAIMGKPMGAGLPLAGVVARQELVDAFRKKTRYFNTFASSPLQAAVGMAVLDVIEDDDVRSNVNSVGNYLRAALDQLQIDYEPMGDVRSHGLSIAIDWVTDRESKAPDTEGVNRVINRLKEKGFLMGSGGSLRNALKIRPPLIFSRENADAFLTAFRETLQEFYGSA
jgi:4-aminobutyrate aminotransferase-like enzyme